MARATVLAAGLNQKYCDLSVANGVGDGSSGNPWSLGDAITNGPTWDILWTRGNGASTTTQTLFAGGSTNQRYIIGCDSSWNVVLGPYDANIPVWDCTGGAGDGWDLENHCTVYGIYIKNAGANCFGSFNSNAAIICCRASGAGADGFANVGITMHYGCVSHNNTTHGFDAGSSDAHFAFCEAYDNGSWGFNYSTVSAWATFSNCFAHGNTLGGFAIDRNTWLTHCTMDGQPQGANWSDYSGGDIACIYSNHTANPRTHHAGSNASWWATNYNNVGSPESSARYVGILRSPDNPEYTNIAAAPPDYECAATDIVNYISNLIPNNDASTGAWQGGGGAAGGGGVGTIITSGLIKRKC